MINILIGSIAFALIAIYDWAQMRKYTWLKPLFFISGAVFYIGFTGVISTPVDINLAYWVTLGGYICFFIFTLLLIYSILVEISIHSYLNRDNEHILVETGTYALSRHPGVLWFFGAAVSMIALHPSYLTVLAAIIWTTLDVLLVWIEDRYIFPKSIPGYEKYKTTVPFLLPDKKSIRHCLKTLKPKPLSTCKLSKTMCPSHRETPETRNRQTTSMEENIR